jgi:hypothetical protein
MEDDLEEYWAAIRPAPKPSISSLQDELLKIAKLREEEWDLMTRRNSPPTSEVMMGDFLEGTFFESSGGVPASLPMVVNVANPSPGEDSSNRQYVDLSLGHSEHPIFYGDDNSTVRIDPSSLRSLQVESTGVQVRSPVEVTSSGLLSGGRPLMISEGSSGAWLSQADYTHRLDLAGNDDFVQLQNNLSNVQLQVTNTITELLTRVERLEHDNQELRAMIALLEFNTRSR